MIILSTETLDLKVQEDNPLYKSLSHLDGETLTVSVNRQAQSAESAQKTHVPTTEKVEVAETVEVLRSPIFSRFYETFGAKAESDEDEDEGTNLPMFIKVLESHLLQTLGGVRDGKTTLLVEDGLLLKDRQGRFVLVTGEEVSP